MKLNKYLNESKNIALYKKVKDLSIDLNAIAKKIKNGDFPYDEENIKEIMEQEFTGIKITINNILRMV